MRLDEILTIVAFIVFAIIALVLARKFSNKSHKMLTRLVAANIGLDLIAIAIWAVFPQSQWSIYRLNFAIVGAEAALASVVFAVTLFGLMKKLKWAPFLAIAATVTQRVFATYVFFPSSAIGITLIWSLLIIYFAYTDIKTAHKHP